LPKKTIVKEISDTITSKEQIATGREEHPTFAMTVIFINCPMFCPKIRYGKKYGKKIYKSANWIGSIFNKQLGINLID